MKKFLLLSVAVLTLAVAPVQVVAQESASDEASVERIVVMSKMYRLQADILEAEAEQRLSRFETLIDSAYTQLAVLSEDSVMRQDPRYREL